MTALEWLEQRIKDTYDKEGKLPIAYTLDLVKQAKEIEEEDYTKEYVAKTALEWYIKQMFELNTGDFKSKRGYLGKRRQIENQALAMEKEQLNLARLDGINLANQGYGKPLDPEYMRKWIQKNAAPKTTHDPENP